MLESPQTVQTLPNFSFVTLKGKAIDQDAFKGKVSVIHFWSISCAICLEEMPEMIEVQKKWGGEKFAFVAIAMSYDPPMYVMDFQAKKHLPFIVGMDSNSLLAKAFGKVELTPTTFLFDQQGKLIKSYVGRADFSEFNQLIEQQLQPK